MKKKGGKMVPNCVKEITELYYEVDGKGYGYTFEYINDGKLNEAEYQGRKVKLGKIMQGDAKKFKVYVKNPKGNVVKVNFGQGGKAKGGTMKIRKSNPKARKSFRARHNCKSPVSKLKARFFLCSYMVVFYMHFFNNPSNLRNACRNGIFTSTTSGHAPGYMQANVVILESSEAIDFSIFCHHIRQT